MQLLISDANILIDMEEGLLVAHMFKLPYEFVVPDILYMEELEEAHQGLMQAGLQLGELDGDTMGYAARLTQHYTKTSRHDCFALALAKARACPLLTGDKALRSAAEQESVDVKGTLWLVEEMIRYKLLPVSDARMAYQRMRVADRRLPWKIAEEGLVRLEMLDSGR